MGPANDADLGVCADLGVVPVRVYLGRDVDAGLNFRADRRDVAPFDTDVGFPTLVRLLEVAFDVTTDQPARSGHVEGGLTADTEVPVLVDRDVPFDVGKGPKVE